MASYNRVILMGNLTRDPELRYLPSGMALCEFGLAVNRRYRDRDDNQKDEVCFVDITAWGRQAETINQYMSKGRAILIEGRLKFDQWTSQDGQKRSKLSVVAERFQFVGGREGAGAPAGSPREQVAAPPEHGPEPAAPPMTPDYPAPDSEPLDQGPPDPEHIPF